MLTLNLEHELPQKPDRTIIPSAQRCLPATATITSPTTRLPHHLLHNHATIHGPSLSLTHASGIRYPSHHQPPVPPVRDPTHTHEPSHTTAVTAVPTHRIPTFPPSSIHPYGPTRCPCYIHQPPAVRPTRVRSINTWPEVRWYNDNALTVRVESAIGHNTQ
ncbi:hypothetical protein BJY04DRAFT_15632 [Aspergillus karnatakaensis]|uniref:uncharacterized protein n=1 Tax=Aspergillus karnatakaensis TaxID=1810916 RepID=UPI003CCCE098